MTTGDASGSRPPWLSIDGKLSELGSSDLEAGNRESAVHRIAEALDGTGYNVSRHAGNLLELRAAVDARSEVGRLQRTGSRSHR
jgi:hypothetical protein